MFVTKKKYDEVVSENQKLKNDLDWALWCLKRIDIEANAGFYYKDGVKQYIEVLCRHNEEMKAIHDEIVSKTTKEP